MITTLIGVQSICIGVSAYLAYKSQQKSTKLKRVKSEKGFKHYKAGGF